MLKNGQELVRTKLDGSLRASLHIELLPFAREANQASVNSFIHPHVFIRVTSTCTGFGISENLNN